MRDQPAGYGAPSNGGGGYPLLPVFPARGVWKTRAPARQKAPPGAAPLDAGGWPRSLQAQKPRTPSGEKGMGGDPEDPRLGRYAGGGEGRRQADLDPRNAAGEKAEGAGEGGNAVARHEDGEADGMARRDEHQRQGGHVEDEIEQRAGGRFHSHPAAQRRGGGFQARRKVFREILEPVAQQRQAPRPLQQGGETVP